MSRRRRTEAPPPPKHVHRVIMRAHNMPIRTGSAARFLVRLARIAGRRRVGTRLSCLYRSVGPSDAASSRMSQVSRAVDSFVPLRGEKGKPWQKILLFPANTPLTGHSTRIGSGRAALQRLADGRRLTGPQLNGPPAVGDPLRHTLLRPGAVAFQRRGGGGPRRRGGGRRGGGRPPPPLRLARLWSSDARYAPRRRGARAFRASRSSRSCCASARSSRERLRWYSRL
jgi:hypothetical protein